MALNTHKNLKKYYSIGEVAAQFGVAESLLRFWEKEFPSIHPGKNYRGVRQYTDEDIDEIRKVHTLVKVRGLKLAATRQLLSKNREGASDTAELILKLQDVRDELTSISKELSQL